MNNQNHLETNSIQRSAKSHCSSLFCLTAIWLVLALLLPNQQLINGADCLTNVQLTSNSSYFNNATGYQAPGQQYADRVLVVRPTGPINIPSSSHKKAKETFREKLDEKLEISVMENTPIGSKLTDIEADNTPGLHNAGISYAIIDGTDQNSFSLRPSSQVGKVELVNEINFDYEASKRQYNVMIRATSLYLRYEVVVTIKIMDENDNKPQIDDFTIVFNNYKNNFPTGPIGQVPASDADSSDQLRYRILAGNNAQLVVVNETTGDIHLNPWLNGNVPIRGVIILAVSDGVHEEAVAQMVIIVNLVTEAMLQNSINIRLDGITMDEFMNAKYETFLNSITRILAPIPNYQPNNIVIIDIEDPNLSGDASAISYKVGGYDSTTNATSSINVSFSARAAGNDVESYLSSQYIEERVYMSRAYLSQALGVNVAPFQDNLCLTEPCENYQECQATYKFDKAAKTFIKRGNMFFRPIRATQSYLCNCPSTFTGMKHKSECNLQINQCLMSPCLNDGICHMHENGFTCECKQGYIGSRCQHSFANSTCQSIASTEVSSIDQKRFGYISPTVSCAGRSKCVDLNNLYFNSKTGPLGVTPSGFTCQSCPNQQWSTDLCQLKARSFARKSYITLPSLKKRHRFHLQIKFATFQNDALLLYNGRYNDKHDFIALEIVSSYLKFSYSLGASAITNVTLPSISVSDGNWHTVTVDYKDRNVTLIVDDCDPLIDEGLSRSHNTNGPGPKRCSNTTSPDANIRERALDLTSPMQLGSLLPIPVEYRINAPGFIGCMSDLYVDHQLIDLYNPILESNTQPGCPEKRNFCQQHSCNGKPCQDAWGAAKCHCGDDMVGKYCEISVSNERVRRFSGNSYLAFNPFDSSIRSTWQVSLHFRTINPNGVLMKILLDDQSGSLTESSILFEISNGGFKIAHRGQNLTYTRQPLDDGEWHYAELVWSSEYAQLTLDYNTNLAIQSPEMGSVAGSTIKSVIMGASQTGRQTSGDTSTEIPADIAMSVPNIQPEDYLSVFSPTTSNTSQNFVGCIYGLNISDNTDSWLSVSDERNVERGCQIIDPCESNPCPVSSRCVRRGMSQYKCICQPGYVGDRCLPICDLNPCQGEGSRCIPAPGLAINPDQTTSSNGQLEQSLSPAASPSALLSQQEHYKCECGPYRTGKNCEQQLHQRCPSNWWGQLQSGSNSSICTPCNCDESKGFHGDCDKLTSECICKQDYYQPFGSDQCLPCNCYQDGSLRSRSCHQRTGQCKCRPGVVGRRCDTCVSSFAQVTVRGCEVVYDGCPKSFSDGVWWDRTSPDMQVTQQCPVLTSTGTATRLCDKTKGWQKPDMFHCISNLFSDLYHQYRVLEENKFQIKLGLANKIASNLRQALNETASNPNLQLYGSDMYISFRLIHHLINHETAQTGMNLTHRQDRSYIPNLVESISYLLDPINAENWPQIIKRSPNGGPESLLKLMDSYSRIIIENQPDTYMEPFEFNSRYFTFGLDIYSGEHSSWDTSKLGVGVGLSPTNGASIFGSPPYATDPFAPSNSMTSDSDDQESSGNGDRQQQQGRHSEYSSFNRESMPSLIVPKARMSFAVTNRALNDEESNISAIDESTFDDTTKIFIPYKTLRVKSSVDTSLQSSFYQTKSRAKRDDLIIPDLKYTRKQPALVVYSIYRSLGALLPNNLDNTVNQRLSMMVVPNSPVVWLTIRPANSSEFLAKNIQPKINYLLKVLTPQGKTRPQCAVWDFATSSSTNTLTSNNNNNNNNNARNQTSVLRQISGSSKHIGRFSTKGCELRGIQHSGRSRFKYDYVNCSCDHLGAVTLLMDDNANYEYLIGDEQGFKDEVTIIALCLSLIILGTTYIVLTYVRAHSIKSNSNSINKNLIIILMLIEVLILYGSISRTSLTLREYQCKLVAVFLHYLSISLFFWLFVNAVHFYRMLTELRDINHGPMKFYHIIGYAIPAFFVSIAVGLRIEQFGNHLFCWLSTNEPIIWSMFGPISFTSFATFTLFMLALCKSLPVKEDPNGADLLKNHMVINIIKTPLIGVYWLISIYVVNESFLLDWALFYPLITVVKSVGLFVLLCLVDKHIRYNMYVSWLRFRGKEVPFLEDVVDYPSNQWMHYVGAENGTLAKNGPYGPYTDHQVSTPGFQDPYGDMFEPKVTGFSTASTTSRSSITGTSSSVYHHHHHHRTNVVKDLPNDYVRGGTGVSRRESKHRRRNKKSHHKHHHHKHHHRDHHHHHHRSHRNHTGEEHGSVHYERRRATESQMNPARDCDNPYLASSHSSDGDDVSMVPKNNNQAKDYQTVSNNSSAQMNSSTNTIEHKQTVPMEIGGSSKTQSEDKSAQEESKKETVQVSQDADDQHQE